MSNIKIETLSQIHIGNGLFLQKGSDFLVDSHSLYVLNMDKLGSVIGTDEANIRGWLDAIDKGCSETFIKTRIKDMPYGRFSKRCIASNVDFDQGQNTLKEYIHDGLGRPYIPGSSIKGAIRTAILSTLAKKEITKKLEKEKDQRKWKKIIFGMESDLLHFISYDKRGKRDLSPTTDIFRFVTTGDAYFDKGVELVVKQMNLNIREQESLIDEKRQQAVETIRTLSNVKNNHYVFGDKVNSIDNSLKGLNFQIFKKFEKEKYMDNLLEQIFYKLSEKENDDIDMKEALNLYEPNKILKSAEDIMKQLGYGDLLDKITYEVIEGDINNNKKDKRENKDNNSNKNKNKKISKKNKTEKKIDTDL